MNPKEKYSIITRNLQEIIQEEELQKLVKGKKQISLYWGTMPTGSISLAYFFPMLKIADFLKAGIKVKILLADLHAFLDGVPWEILDKKTKYYELTIKKILKILGVESTKLEFVKGKDLQLTKNYFQDLMKLSMITTTSKATKAGSEVVKMTETPKLGNLLYPLLQALDEEYLKVDIQFAGVDQRKIMVLAREVLPKIGYKQRIELMTPMIRGLVGEKMSSSIESTKIDLLDEETTINKKIRNADCKEGDTENGIISILQYLIMILKEDKKENLVIERPEKFGGNKTYKTFKELEKDYKAKKIHPLDLKNTVAKEINKLVEKIRKDEKIKKLHKEIYN